MPTSHQICMTFQHHDDELCCSFIASKTKISENPIHLFLGLIGLPLREYFTTTSSSSSSSTSSSSSSSSFSTSFITAFLPPLTPTFLSPLTPSLLSRYNRSNKTYKELSYTDTNKPNMRDTVAFFLTELLSRLLGNSKKSAPTRILLNSYFSSFRANISIRF